MEGADFFFTAFAVLLSVVTVAWMIVYILWHRDPEKSFIAWIMRTLSIDTRNDMTTTPHKHIVPPTKPITPIDAPVDHPKTAPAAAAPKVATRQDLQDALQALVDANCVSYG